MDKTDMNQIRKTALSDTATALRSINTQYDMTPDQQRGQVSEISQARKGAEIAMVSLAIIASDGDEQKTRDILADEGFTDLF
ncbi:MAG: hypothetical protein J6S05_02575 [Bacteroidaceae bacterium]|jgi:hypothetical protein|nr:hypothetical protein [Bacteroidaceae bacterium]